MDPCSKGQTYCRTCPEVQVILKRSAPQWGHSEVSKDPGTVPVRIKRGEDCGDFRFFS